MDKYTLFGRQVLIGLVKDLLSKLDSRLERLLTRPTRRQSRELLKRHREQPRTGGWFTSDEAALLEVLASLIVPSDELSPGAGDADVVDTIDRLVANSPLRRESYSLGLCSFDRWARWKYGRKFLKLSVEYQLRLLKIIDKGPGARGNLKQRLKFKLTQPNLLSRGLYPAVGLFPLLVEDVLEAFYTSKVSWLWLGYDGPPMPVGYPDFSAREPLTEGTEAGAVVRSPPLSDDDMRILVCLKQIPNRNSRFKIDESGGGLNEAFLSWETNESDLYALEEALRLRNELGGEVVVLSLGPKRVIKGLQDALARGADRAIHLNDAEFLNADPFVTAKIIAATARNEDFRIVLTGVESEDLAYAQTGVVLAELLGWAYATIVVDVHVSEDKKSARVKRELENDAYELVEVQLPAVLTIQTGSQTPRNTTLRGVMQARKKEIRALSRGDLGLRSEELGMWGSRIETLKLLIPERKKNTVMLKGPTNELISELIQIIHKELGVL